MSLYAAAAEIVDTLTTEQMNMYRQVTKAVYSMGLDDDNFHDAVLAVEAVGKIMRLSHEAYLARRSLH